MKSRLVSSNYFLKLDRPYLVKCWSGQHPDTLYNCHWGQDPDALYECWLGQNPDALN